MCWIDSTLNAWYHIRYSLRKLIPSLHHRPLPNNFITEFKTVGAVCRTLHRSLWYPGYVQGYYNVRTGIDSWCHACLLVVLLGVPDNDIEAWKEAALLQLLFISGSIEGNHPAVPDLFQELNHLLLTTELGSPGTLGYDLHQQMLNEASSRFRNAHKLAWHNVDTSENTMPFKLKRVATSYGPQETTMLIHFYETTIRSVKTCATVGNTAVWTGNP